jgi:hypothetical protein
MAKAESISPVMTDSTAWFAGKDRARQHRMAEHKQD